MGIENVAGQKMAFINFPQKLIEDRVPLLLPKEKLVVEILEDVQPVNSVITVCQEMNAEGYMIALDDFFYDASLDPLIASADIIKLDFRSMSSDELAKTVEELSGFGVNLLAEKVETYEEFTQAQQMGFTYFQGYFFSKPQILQGKDVSGLQVNLLEIMAETNKKDFELPQLEKFIVRDVAISYKLLRYINSPFFRRVNEISSISQAIVLLGEKGIKSFISLVAMAQLASEKPDELIRASIIRAKFCELIGEMNGSRANSAELFTLGLFSLIDAIMDDSMESIMEKLPLSGSIKSALVSGEGKLIDYLKMIEYYETAKWEGVSKTAAILGLNEEGLPSCYMEAVGWADGFTEF
jgi:EAL and modified HD-GYP domain-containing signal transduction protein